MRQNVNNASIPMPLFLKFRMFIILHGAIPCKFLRSASQIVAVISVMSLKLLNRSSCDLVCISCHFSPSEAIFHKSLRSVISILQPFTFFLVITLMLLERLCQSSRNLVRLYHSTFDHMRGVY
jgi:hypothetical protein